MKQPLVSIIVPTYNNGATIGACLKSIKAQSYKNIEVIVVDNFSTDNTVELANNYTDHLLQRGPERSAQRNYGVKKSNGSIILIIDSDMELTKQVVKQCVAKFSANPVVMGLVIPEESFGIGFWAQCKKLERSFYIGVEWMEAARAFKKDMFNILGGYDELNTGTEDYDLPQRLRALKGSQSISRIGANILHNEQHISLLKTCKKKYYYAQGIEQYVSVNENKINFAKQSSPLRRYGLFLNKYGLLLRSPLLGIGMLYMKTLEMVAGALGYYTTRLKIK